jgi:hemerythrin
MMGKLKGNDITFSKKEYVTWSNSYSIGIKSIDDQHKWLLNFVNDLFSHVTWDETEERLYFREVIQQAVQYGKNHFSIEEKCMLATKFSGYPEHKKAHDDFVLTVVNTVKDFETGRQRHILIKFGRFLKDWVLSHIAVMDTQYAMYFRTIATRKADGKLSITAADVAQ